MIVFSIFLTVPVYLCPRQLSWPDEYHLVKQRGDFILRSFSEGGRKGKKGSKSLQNSYIINNQK